LSLELGGKAPAIVFGDCDVANDPARVAAGALIQAGQQCTALARVLVHESVYERFSANLVEVLKHWHVDFGHVPNAQMGCMISMATRDRIAGWVERAADHERLLLRGDIPRGVWEKGAFIRPSLVEVEDLNSPFVQEEIFGPLLVIERFSTEEEAIERANATRFGLASSVWTADLAKARRVARSIHAGNVWHNTHNRLFAEIETGGFRESGIGKLHGLEAMNDFMHTKHFYYELKG
jgi:acyl-CoA reductase-like NAD-dependent aldehyde dehydrogenase